MPDRTSIIGLIYDSVDEINALLGRDAQIGKADDTSLLIGTTPLDSLGYITLITSLEDKCEERFGQFVPLADGFQSGRVRTISDLADYIASEYSK